jgi:hypothetical protein
MADQVYITPRRNDLDGMNIQVTDLRPNTSQRNLIYDGPGQSGYLKWSLDNPGATQVTGDSYAGGSTQTQPLFNGPGGLTAAATTSGGPNDVGIPTVAQFGLAAYFLERIDRGGIGAPLATPEAEVAALSIFAAVEAGVPPTLANIDAALVAASVPGTGLALGLSFGTVEDVLRMLRGEVYRVRAQTIVTDQTLGLFLPLAVRQGIVAAQTPPDVLAQGQFYAQGAFLEQGEPGFREFRPLLRTGALNISNGEGVLSHLKGNIDWNNPNFAYTAGAVTVLVPRATTLDPVIPLPADGIAPAVYVCDHMGNFL